MNDLLLVLNPKEEAYIIDLVQRCKKYDRQM